MDRRRYVSPLVYWATERESIRFKKAHGNSPPWTNDPILQKYRFCNVRRADDRVSQWLRYNVLQYQQVFTTSVFLQWVALSRWINWPPTLATIIGTGDLVLWDKIELDKIGKLIDKIVKSDTKAWTGAYMVRAPSKRKYPKLTKGRFVTNVVVGAIDTVSLEAAISKNSAQLTWETLCAVPNWGSFMAGQVVADLTYTDLLGGAYDLLTWAPQGPGSRRGFNRLLGRPLKAKIEDAEWSEQLQEWRQQVAKATGVNLNLMDLQNCLCEMDKYLRVKNGQGRPRSTYKPETAF